MRQRACHELGSTGWDTGKPIFFQDGEERHIVPSPVAPEHFFRHALLRVAALLMARFMAGLKVWPLILCKPSRANANRVRSPDGIGGVPLSPRRPLTNQDPAGPAQCRQLIACGPMNPMCRLV